MTASIDATDSPIFILTAEWIDPRTLLGGPQRAYGLAIGDGNIRASAPLSHLRNSFPGAHVEDLGSVIILPGLVNAHVHLELSDAIPAQPPPSDFGSWLLGVIRHTAKAGTALPRQVEDAVREGVRQCLKFGVTSVGDISRQAALTRPVLRDGPLRVTSYGEIQAMGRRRSLFDERLATAVDASQRSDRLRIGLSPHAPYTVEPQHYAACLALAQQRGLPLATHLAETPDEANFLAKHQGPFRELWETIGAWDDAVPTFSGGPIRLAQSLGLLSYPTLLAHVNYCDDEEMMMLAQSWKWQQPPWTGKASVVYCPRTHRYFGHPPHRWREMQFLGIIVALGTDSCASSPDLNLVDDLRLVHELAPEVSASALWGMVTGAGAAAIGQHKRVGSLAPGKAADLVAFPAAGDNPLLSILESDVLPCGVWIGGERIRVD